MAARRSRSTGKQPIQHELQFCRRAIDQREHLILVLGHRCISIKFLQQFINNGETFLASGDQQCVCSLIRGHRNRQGCVWVAHRSLCGTLGIEERLNSYGQSRGRSVFEFVNLERTGSGIIFCIDLFHHLANHRQVFRAGGHNKGIRGIIHRDCNALAVGTRGSRANCPRAVEPLFYQRTQHRSRTLCIREVQRYDGQLTGFRCRLDVHLRHQFPYQL